MIEELFGKVVVTVLVVGFAVVCLWAPAFADSFLPDGSKVFHVWSTQFWLAIVPQSHFNFLLAQVPSRCIAEAMYKELKSRSILVRWWNLPRLADKVRITVGTEEQNDKLLAAVEDIVGNVSDRSSKR